MPPVHPNVTKECEKSVREAYALDLHVHDIDGNGVIDVIDIAPVALRYGMYWIDVAPRDGSLSTSEVSSAYDAIMDSRFHYRVLKYAAKGAVAVSSLFTVKYTSQKVMDDCDANRDGFITPDEYEQLSTTTCMETCDKTEDVFDFVGGKFGKMPRAL